MRHHTISILITILTIDSLESIIVMTDNWGCTNDIESKSMTLRLKRHLFCDYDRTVRPSVHHSNSTTVNLKLIPKFIDFDDQSNMLTLHSWMMLFWEDAHLKWSTSEYEVDTIHIVSDEIWVPDIAVYNSGDMSYEQNGIPTTDCVLTNYGRVLCVPAIKYVTHCVTDYTHWPFDKQNCTIRIGSWAHTGEEIDFHLESNGIMMQDYIRNQEWNVVSANVNFFVQKFKCCPNDTFPMIAFYFVLERHTGAMHAAFVTPAIILIVLSLTILWLDPNSIERLVVACINFICHLLCMQNLYWQLPSNGSSSPHILIFFRNSMIMAGFVIFLTVFLRQLREISLPAPRWISSAVYFILESRAGQFLLLNTLDSKASAGLEAEAEDNADLVRAGSEASITKSAWGYLTILIGRVSFLGVLLTYIVMLLILVPVTDSHKLVSSEMRF